MCGVSTTCAQASALFPCRLARLGTPVLGVSTVIHTGGRSTAPVTSRSEMLRTWTGRHRLVQPSRAHKPGRRSLLACEGECDYPGRVCWESPETGPGLNPALGCQKSDSAASGPSAGLPGLQVISSPRNRNSFIQNLILRRTRGCAQQLMLSVHTLLPRPQGSRNRHPDCSSGHPLTGDSLITPLLQGGKPFPTEPPHRRILSALAGAGTRLARDTRPGSLWPLPSLLPVQGTSPQLLRLMTSSFAGHRAPREPRWPRDLSPPLLLQAPVLTAPPLPLPGPLATPHPPVSLG